MTTTRLVIGIAATFLAAGCATRETAPYAQGKDCFYPACSIAVDVVDGVTLRGCAKTDDMCASPLDTQTSDANGIAKMHVPLGTTGFDGYVDFAGGGVEPLLNYFNPPVIHGPCLRPSSRDPWRDARSAR